MPWNPVPAEPVVELDLQGDQTAAGGLPVKTAPLSVSTPGGESRSGGRPVRNLPRRPRRWRQAGHRSRGPGGMVVDVEVLHPDRLASGVGQPPVRGVSLPAFVGLRAVTAHDAAQRASDDEEGGPTPNRSEVAPDPRDCVEPPCRVTVYSRMSMACASRSRSM